MIDSTKNGLEMNVKRGYTTQMEQKAANITYFKQAATYFTEIS